MTIWLYQMSAAEYSHEDYRAEVWEGRDTAWATGKISATNNKPQRGDTLVFYYVETRADDPGIYGWAIVLGVRRDADGYISFRPAAPSDHLKLNPLWDSDVEKTINSIRGRVAQGTMWPIDVGQFSTLRQKITRHAGGSL